MFMLFSVDVYAFPKVPDEVTEAANKGINNFKEGINENKEGFGLSSSDNIDNITLANGYECYKISSAAQNKFKKSLEITTIDELFEASGNYIFPIKIQDKCVGIAIVEKTNNKWDVIGVSGYTKFESDLTFSKENLSKKHTNLNINANDKIKLVYDKSFGVFGIASSADSSNVFIPMKDDKLKKWDKGSELNLKQTSNDISKFVNHEYGGVKIGGYGGNERQNKYHTNIIVITSILLVLTILGILYILKSTNKVLYIKK